MHDPVPIRLVRKMGAGILLASELGGQEPPSLENATRGWKSRHSMGNRRDSAHHTLSIYCCASMTWRWRRLGCTVSGRQMWLCGLNYSAFRCASFLRNVNLWRLGERRYRSCRSIFRGYHRDLPSRPFHLIPQLTQPGLHLLAMVALNLDHAVFDGAAGATQFL
jgi:hypothetical protein